MIGYIIILLLVTNLVITVLAFAKDIQQCAANPQNTDLSNIAKSEQDVMSTIVADRPTNYVFETGKSDQTFRASDTCVVITGLLTEDLIGILIHMYRDIPTESKLISTWKSTPDTWIQRLAVAGFQIVLNDPVVNNDNTTNRQTTCIRNGCLAAKRPYVIRMRTDVLCNDMSLFIRTIKPLYSEKITVLCGLEWGHFFFFDLFVAGPLSEMLKMFDKQQTSDDKRAVEVYWQEQYINKSAITMTDFVEKCYFCLPTLQKTTVDFEWFNRLGPDKWLIADHIMIAGYYRTYENVIPSSQNVKVNDSVA